MGPENPSTAKKMKMKRATMISTVKTTRNLPVNRAMLFLFPALCALAALSAPPASHAQGPATAFPSRAVRVVLPVPPGGLQDSLARAMGIELGKAWGQPLVVENRAGGNGIVAGNAVAKAPPDGHMLWMGTMVQLSNDLIPGRSVPFDPAKDLLPVIGLVDAGSVLVVRADFPAKNLQELFAIARAKPGALNYGSFGVGSLPHIDTVALTGMTGTSAVHVPYKGGVEILQGILSGQIAFSIVGITATLPMIRDGRLRPLAYGGLRRSLALPDAPTFPEAGVKGFTTGGWFGWFAPAGTPRPVVDRIANDASRVLLVPEFRDKFVHAAGLEVVNLMPDAFAEAVRTDRATYSTRLKALGNVKLD
jgi:tripartite-type tricarboxylate transporter receptor subunit TctC